MMLEKKSGFLDSVIESFPCHAQMTKYCYRTEDLTFEILFDVPSKLA